jgi:diadenosine tetraphosphatase ApaH/serine/threonine PP2A family protein phosphatase
LKLAVVSDLHANLEALEAVLDAAGGMEILCLGDLVDYGAEPNEVIDLLRGRGSTAVMGNHDAAVLTGDTSMFNQKAAVSSAWTRGELTERNREFLRGLPLELTTPLGGGSAYWTHGSPDDHLWEYVDPSTHHLLFGHYLARQGVGVMGLGHTHVPYVWREGGGVVFNPGSVGQPRDGDWRASFAVVEESGDGVEVQVKRVEYDCQAAASKIRAAGLPESFADRLLPRDGRNG